MGSPTSATSIPYTHLFSKQRPLEEPQECRQTKAVHVVNLAQITDDEVEIASVLCERQVRVTLLIERHLQALRLIERLRDRDAARLRLVQRVQQFLVLEDRAFSVGQLLQ